MWWHVEATTINALFKPRKVEETDLHPPPRETIVGAGVCQAYIWEDKVFRSDFVGGRLAKNIVSATELDAKIAGALPGSPAN